jgi:hypothetical protein
MTSAESETTCIAALTGRDRARVTWFRARHVSGPLAGSQCWEVQALASMSDIPIGAVQIHFDGIFCTEGVRASAKVLDRAGFIATTRWEPTRRPTTWVLSSLQPSGTL